MKYATVGEPSCYSRFRFLIWESPNHSSKNTIAIFSVEFKRFGSMTIIMLIAICSQNRPQDNFETVLFTS